MAELEKKGLLFVGSGVSGGEEGARYGPSLSECFVLTKNSSCISSSWLILLFLLSPSTPTVPGGSDAAWPHIKEIFQKTAAQTDGERE